MIQIKRIYDPVDEEDGYRILIDRLWPRGFSKEKACIDLWMKEVAPSSSLRKWYHHEIDNWEEFANRYKEELTEKRMLLMDLMNLEKEHKKVTLLFSAKDPLHNQAIILLRFCVLYDKCSSNIFRPIPIRITPPTASMQKLIRLPR